MVVIPSVFNLLLDFVGKLTSEQVKDWYCILLTNIAHITTIVTKTPSERKLQENFTTFSNDIFEILRSDTLRQVIVDSISCFTKII